ncbi:MAG: hypothetical protein ACTHKN_20530 [Achromobacter mucicolens]|uniref:hypothetical protein n=1 Tax=Achromobacter mucicolens TaxID=1389922 RepID=UPI0020A2DDC3|nr:hypothetical protein [Achromobacter mucicolens]MCP2516600.1 hypothetical protein [Achromobacter mucicolens]
MKAIHILLESSAQRQVPTEHQGPFSRLSSLAFIPLSRDYPFTIISLAVIGVGPIILGTE